MKYHHPDETEKELSEEASRGSSPVLQLDGKSELKNGKIRLQSSNPSYIFATISSMGGFSMMKSLIWLS